MWQLCPNGSLGMCGLFIPLKGTRMSKLETHKYEEVLERFDIYSNHQE
jgi:hypothetical protein